MIDKFRRDQLTKQHTYNQIVNLLYAYIDAEKVNQIWVELNNRTSCSVPVTVEFKEDKYIANFKVYNSGLVRYYDTNLKKWIKIDLFK